MNTSASRLCLAAVVLAACSDDRASTPPVDPVLEAKIERGRYLTNHVSLCGFCHTPLLADGSRDATRFLADLKNGLQPKFTAELEEFRKLKVNETGDANARTAGGWDGRSSG